MADFPRIEPLGEVAAIAAALRTGIVSSLTDGPKTPREIADRLGLDRRATALVLDVLATTDLVRREGERVAAGPALTALADRPGGYTFSLEMWAHTEEFLRTGEPFVAMDLGPEERERAYRDVVGGLAKMFEGTARDLATELPLSPTQILDVGCGSGVWSLALAQRHRDAHVTGLDLPAVLSTFEARAAALSLSDRAHLLAGDMHEVTIPEERFDLVIVANVLRLETPERAANLVRRIARGVASGGKLLVIDALAAGTPERERAVAWYALHLGLRTRTGQVHRAEVVTSWLADAGLTGTTTIDVGGGAGGIGGLLATRASEKSTKNV